MGRFVPGSSRFVLCMDKRLPEPGSPATEAGVRAAVIGLGGVGTAAARFLAAAGCEVIGFEQFALDHDRGSSYGASRIIRRVYPDALYARLMDEAYPLWRELEAETGEELLLACGGLFFGPEDHPEMAATEDALGRVGVPFERLSAGDVWRRFPEFRLRPDEYAIWDAESGLLRASRCVRAAAASARRAGAELRTGVRVEALEPADGGVRLRVDGEWMRFDRAVVTAGPWTGRLLAPLASLPLRVTRQHYAHFRTADPARFSPARFPVWIDMSELVYGFPEHDGIPGAKVALHVPGPPWDPESADREPHPEDDEPLRAYMQRRIPAASGETTLRKVCLYTMSSDEDFLIGRLPGCPAATFIGGLSGHGFKFTILLGRIAAHLCLGQEPGVPLERFQPQRFETASQE